MTKNKSIIICLALFTGICTAQEKKPNNFEDWSSKPEKVVPAGRNRAPSDGMVLFHDNLDMWSFVDGTDVTWPASEEGFAVVPGTKSIITRQAFGSCQLHVEWRVPADEDKGESLDWGNSGLKFMGLYELQIYNSYNDEHEIYYNGQAASIYKQHSPLVNCCKKPGEWESFDVVFTAPEFNKDGSVLRPAYFTVFQNGILVQNHVEVRGTTMHTKYTEYNKHDTRLPLLLQSHGSAVEYRNIWIRDLDAKKLDNPFYAFNNCTRTLPNAPEGMVEQAKFIKKLGFDGFSGHHNDDYFARRKAMDEVGLEMPEIYLPIHIKKDGSVSYKNAIYDIIKDSKDRNLLVALAAHADPVWLEDKEEGDKHMVKAVQELADFAAPYGVKLAVYPHANFYCERLDHSIKICKEVDRSNVGAIFNTIHLFLVEGMEGWEQKLKDAVPHLYMISVNGIDAGDTQNMDNSRLIQPLGEGSFDTYQIVKVAKDNGYEGLFGLQCYNIKQDCSTAMKKSMKTWESYRKRYSEE